MNKKSVRKLAAAAAIMVAAANISPLNVSAAGVKDAFDAKYYADTYADLKAAFGDNEKALFNHYMKYGLAEGRQGSATFNLAEYRKAYADLEASFGNNWDAYVNHYYKYGKNEGRTAGVISADSTVPAVPVADVTADMAAPETPATDVTPAVSATDTSGSELPFPALVRKDAPRGKEYDAAGRLVKALTPSYDDGSWCVYEYDAAGNLLRWVSYLPSGELEGYHAFDYDAESNSTSVHVADALGGYESNYSEVGRPVVDSNGEFIFR